LPRSAFASYGCLQQAKKEKNHFFEKMPKKKKLFNLSRLQREIHPGLYGRKVAGNQ